MALSVLNLTQVDMNAPMTPKSSMQNANSSGPAVSPSPGYSPSVPISLYREVSADLQKTKASMEALKQQNQQLIQQNQQLRQEIEKAVQSALDLRQAAENLPPIHSNIPSSVRVNVTPKAKPAFRLPVMPFYAPKPVEDDTPNANHFPEITSEDLVIEQESQPRRKFQLDQETTGELGGWWLGVVLMCIVITAFGAGFLIVRPLLPASHSK